MKRKAEDELVSLRAAPSSGSLESPAVLFPYRLKHDEAPDTESQDGASETEDVHSTPVTTALSTASRRFPSDLKTIPCTWPNCTKTFNRPARLTAHLRSHNNDRPFKCSECDKTYMEEKHLRQHVKGSHRQERGYVCEACGKAFLTATRLRRHAAVHEGQDRFRCRGYDAACTRTFRKHQTLQRHIRVDHLGQAAFVCGRENCGALFDSAGALRRHVVRAHGTAKYWCEECEEGKAEDGEGEDEETGVSGRGFSTKALLEAHMRQQHASCLFCDARCAGPAALHRHIDMHHSGKTLAERRTTVCPHAGCGKAFTRQANLNVHIRVAHEGLRFVCGQPDTPGCGLSTPCGRSFVSKSKLEEHVRYVHLGHARPPTTTAPRHDSLLNDLAGTKRTLACPHAACSARFVRHHDLRQHERREHAGHADNPNEADMLDAYADLGLSPPRIEADDQPEDRADEIQWQMDEAEMQQLIGDEGLLDPKLFDI